MTTKFQHSGKVLDMVAPSGGVVSGAPLIIGSVFGIPETDADETEQFPFRVDGVNTLPKASGFAPATGTPAYWDEADEELNSDTANPCVGVYETAPGSSAVTADVKLYGPIISDLTALGSRTDALEAKVNNGGTLEVRVDALETADTKGLVMAKSATTTDTSTGVTAGTNETAFTTLKQIAANTLAAGDIVRVRAKVFALATHTTDTLALKLKAAAAAGLVASTCILSSVAAVDAADSNSWELTAEFKVVAIGAAATATFNGSGASWKNGATPAFLGTAIDDDTSVATNAIIDLGVTYQWSASDAGNQAVLKKLDFEIIRPTGT